MCHGVRLKLFTFDLSATHVRAQKPFGFLPPLLRRGWFWREPAFSRLLITSERRSVVKRRDARAQARVRPLRLFLQTWSFVRSLSVSNAHADFAVEDETCELGRRWRGSCLRWEDKTRTKWKNWKNARVFWFLEVCPRADRNETLRWSQVPGDHVLVPLISLFSSASSYTISGFSNV